MNKDIANSNFIVNGDVEWGPWGTIAFIFQEPHTMW